jgi:hypothetical protein
MPFEQSKFGTGGAAGTGNVVSVVNNFFGQRQTGKTAGIMNTEGALNELVIDIDRAVLAAGTFPLTAPALPAGAKVIRALVEVQEVFILGGTTPAIKIGTKTTEATNGLTITEAQAEALGVYDVTASLAGTWLAGLAARTTLGIALSGTGPTNGATGKARVVVQYSHF